MLDKIVVNSYNLWLVIFVAIGTISTAYGLAIIGSTVGQPNFYTYFNLAPAGEPGYDHTTNMIGALNGVNSAGAIFGCWTNAWSADKYGRKMSMMGGCVVLICPSAVYIACIYFLFPETKGRTLEEIGSLFGDTNIANHWYGLTEEEKARIHDQALDKVHTHNGEVPEKVDVDEAKRGDVDKLEEADDKSAQRN